jgi:hypothetical protein
VTDNPNDPNLPKPEDQPAKAGPIQSDPLSGVDLSSLRLSQDFASSVGVKKAILTIPVRKPSRQAFVRVRPGEAWRFQTVLLELKEERETYLVHPALVGELSSELSPTVLHFAIDRQGVLFLWPTRLPSADGRTNTWNQTAADAAGMAEERWVSMRSSMSLGAYEVFEAIGAIAAPDWPDLTMEQAIKVAFKDRFIDTNDHPVLRRLRGEL